MKTSDTAIVYRFIVLKTPAQKLHREIYILLKPTPWSEKGGDATMGGTALHDFPL